MRNSGLIASLVALSLFGSPGHGQESTIKADDAASKSSARSATLESYRDTVAASENQETTQPASQPIAVEPNVFLQTEPVVVAEWDGGQFTNHEVSATLALKRPASLRTLTPDQFARLTHNQQVDAIKLLVWDEILLEEAIAGGLSAETSEVANVVKQQEEAILNRLYYENTIAPAIEEQVLENARKYYDENKETRFTRPAVKTYRALHVSTYELVTAEDGDTLDQLAEEISGDAEKASFIRQNTPPYFQRGVPTEIEDHVLSSPLRGGETVFVPMSEDAVSSATELAERLREEMLNGKTVDELAAASTSEDFSVSATQAIQINEEAGYWDEILDGAASIDETSVSEVIKTPIGLNILALENDVTTSVYEFDEIQEILISEMNASEPMRRQAVEDTREEIINQLWEKYNVQVNDEVVSRPNPNSPDVLSTSTVVVTADGDFQYHLEQFMTDLRMTGKDWGQLTKQERMDVLNVAPSIISYLIAREARDTGLADDPEFRERMEALAEAAIVSEYRKQKAENRIVTDEDLRTFYADNLDKYTSAAQVTVRELSKRINMTLPPQAKAKDIEAAKNSLNEIRSRITSEEDFAQLARRESEAISTRSRGGLIGTVPEDFRGETFRNQVRQLEEGEISEPFLYGSEVMIIRLDDRLAPTVQPFEQVRRQVIQDYSQTMPKVLRDRDLEAALKKVNFKLHF